MKKLMCCITVIVMMFVGSIVQAQVEIVNVKSNEDDLVIAFGEVLEPIDGFWVFEIEGNNLSLQGNPYNFRNDRPKSTRELPPELAAMLTDEFIAASNRRESVQSSALKKFSVEGKDSMENYLSLQEEISSFVIKGNTLIIQWKDFPVPASVELTSHHHAENPLPKTSQHEGLLKLIARFEEILVKEQGLVFGNGYRIPIPAQKKAGFILAFTKLKEEGEITLSEQDKMNLPKNSRFINDVAERR